MDEKNVHDKYKKLLKDEIWSYLKKENKEIIDVHDLKWSGLSLFDNV